jgi:hypothetical protein
MVSKPFLAAERYIQLKKRCVPSSWMDWTRRINDMFIMPLIALVSLILDKNDYFFLLSTFMTAARSWRDQVEFEELKFEMQKMRFQMAATGGPRIVTNDPTYMAYVWADAVTRSSRPRLRAVHRLSC